MRQGLLLPSKIYFTLTKSKTYNKMIIIELVHLTQMLL